MSTNSTIAFQNEDNSVSVVYCHWDSYIEGGVGQMLFENYQDPEKIERLMAGGSISILAENVNIPEGVNHSFEKPDDSTTVFYHRDRGEELVIKKFLDMDSYIMNNDWLEYNYLYAEHDDINDNRNRTTGWVIIKPGTELYIPVKEWFTKE
jgi:hypothetical protein